MILKPNETNVPLLNHLNKFSAEHNDICSGNVSRRIACSFFIPHAPTTNLPQKSSILKRPAPCVHLFWVEATSSVRRSDCNKCEWIWPPWRKKLHGSSSKSWNWKLRCFQKIDSSEGRGWVLGWGFFSPVGCFIVTWILAVFGECDSRVCWGVLWSGSETMRTYWEVQQKVIMFHPHLRKFFWWTAQLPTIPSSFAKKPCHGIPGSCGEWSGMACKLNAETFLCFQLQETSHIALVISLKSWGSVSFVYHLLEEFLWGKMDGEHSEDPDVPVFGKTTYCQCWIRRFRVFFFKFCWMTWLITVQAIPVVQGIPVEPSPGVIGFPVSQPAARINSQQPWNSLFRTGLLLLSMGFSRSFQDLFHSHYFPFAQLAIAFLRFRYPSPSWILARRQVIFLLLSSRFSATQMQHPPIEAGRGWNVLHVMRHLGIPDPIKHNDIQSSVTCT